MPEKLIIQVGPISNDEGAVATAADCKISLQHDDDNPMPIKRFAGISLHIDKRPRAVLHMRLEDGSSPGGSLPVFDARLVMSVTGFAAEYIRKLEGERSRYFLDDGDRLALEELLQPSSSATSSQRSAIAKMMAELDLRKEDAPK